ncbi:MAG: branched-chain amino acid ABC transporter permease [Betaproteobacteria bacterium]|jgi:branched-chain amino acid transport system permease protein
MTDFLLTLAVLAGLNVLLASGFNVILGYGGLVSVAQPVFYALGAYSSALLSMKLGVPIPLAIVLGALVAAITSIGVSLPSLRVSGDYLVIASLGFQLGIVHIINNVELTGAASGLSNIPSLIEGKHRAAVYAAAIALIAAAVVLAIRWLVGGPYGRAITAMRNDEEAFASLGRDAMRIKIVLFALGSGIAGLAGGLYAHFFLFLTPDQFGIFASATLLTMVVVGGTATVYGPVVGAVLLTVLPEAIRFIDLPIAVMAPLQGAVFTVLVIVFIFFRPEGLLGGAIGGLKAWRRRGRQSTHEKGAR